MSEWFVELGEWCLGVCCAVLSWIDHDKKDVNEEAYLISYLDA